MNDIIQNDDQTGAKITAQKTAKQLTKIKNCSKLGLIKKNLMETFKVLMTDH